MKTKIAVILALALLSTRAANARHVHTDMMADMYDYKREASLIHARLAQDGLPTSVAVIEKTLRAIDSALPLFFPRGPFGREDMIALAWLESGFHQREGGTHGERGLFQIMPDEFARWHVTKDFYDINVNTIMALRVLKYKQGRWHDYKLTIQAYNGIVRLRDGRISERYWRAFVKRKIAVEELLGEK